MSTWIRILVTAGVVLQLACNRVVVTGEVVNVKGEGLPGVAVTVEGADYQALTNALGEYRISCQPGHVQLLFAKSGYAPVRLEFVDAGAGQVRAPGLELWRLPPNAGVYLFDDASYEEATWAEPKRFFLADGELAYGTTRSAALLTALAEPLIVCFKTPRHDARLSRLRQADARLGAGHGTLFKVWTAAGTTRADLTPIDEAEGMLLQLRPVRPLEPGTYAVHWGALDGYTALETRMFMFTVTAANAEEDPGEEPVPGLPESPGEEPEPGLPEGLGEEPEPRLPEKRGTGAE